ncbi:hypothetical protein ACFVGM_09240 [Kitasatospora purpeofusca]|uniref:hypothetical protein n=1 Tax=Kitasatospora purpeofusca TaxID=67352 RepID=UPI00369BF9CB
MNDTQNLQGLQPGHTVLTEDGIRLTFHGLENDLVRFSDPTGALKAALLPGEPVERETMSDGSLWHPHVPNTVEFTHFNLVEMPASERYPKFWHLRIDTYGSGGGAATIWFDEEKQQYWAEVKCKSTKHFDTLGDVLHAAIGLYYLGRLGEQHPVIAALYRRVRKLNDAVAETRDKAFDEGKQPNRTAAVLKAEAGYEAGLNLLAAALDAAGYDVAGYGGFPSADRAAMFLNSWVGWGKQENLSA